MTQNAYQHLFFVHNPIDNDFVLVKQAQFVPFYTFVVMITVHCPYICIQHKKFVA